MDIQCLGCKEKIGRAYSDRIVLMDGTLLSGDFDAVIKCGKCQEITPVRKDSGIIKSNGNELKQSDSGSTDANSDQPGGQNDNPVEPNNDNPPATGGGSGGSGSDEPAQEPEAPSFIKK